MATSVPTAAARLEALFRELVQGEPENVNGKSIAQSKICSFWLVLDVQQPDYIGLAIYSSKEDARKAALGEYVHILVCVEYGTASKKPETSVRFLHIERMDPSSKEFVFILHFLQGARELKF